MRVNAPLIIAAVGWTALAGCRKDAVDALPRQGQEAVEEVDTLARIVGRYEGVLSQASFSMPNNNASSTDTVILEVVIDSILDGAINLVGVEEHMIVNPDLSLTLTPGSGYGGGRGFLLLGDSIVVMRSQGALAWNFSRSFKGHKID